MVVSKGCSVGDLWGWALLRAVRARLNSKETKGEAELSHVCAVPHYTDSGNLTVASWNG